MKIKLIILLFLNLLILSAFAYAESASPTDLKSLASSLNLEPGQKEKVYNILQKAGKRQQEILKSYGIVLGENTPIELGFRELRAMKSKMTEVRTETETQLGSVLNSAQLEEFKSLRDERAKELRAEIEKRRR